MSPQTVAKRGRRGWTWTRALAILAAVAALAVAGAACGGSGDSSDGGDTSGGDTTSAATTSAATTPETTAAEEGEESADGKPLTIAISSDFETLDIRGLGSAQTFSVLRHITEPLIRFDAEGNIEPSLATAWEQVDPLTLRFDLRTDATFSNGNPFNAEAAKYSIEKVLDPEFNAWNRSYIEGLIESVNVIDDHTLEIKQTTPTTRLLNGLTTVDIVDPAHDQTGAQTTEPIGTGPYKFVSFTPRQQLELERNADYWGEAPASPTITVRIIPDPSTQVAALQAGEVQLISNLPFASLEAVETGDETAVAAADSARLVFLALNNKKAPLDDPKVRQAINYAIDKQQIIDGILDGEATLPGGPCAPLTKFCRTDLGYDYDPEKAKQLLEEAGYDGEEITLTIGQGRYPNDNLVGQAIAAQLQEVGLNVKLNTIDYSSLGSQLSDSNGNSPFDIWLQGWSADDNNLSGMLQAIFGTESAVYPIGYGNPQVDDALAAASSTIDEGEIQASLDEAQELIATDAPIAFLYVPKQDIGISKNLTGFTPRFDEYFFLWDAKLD